MIIWWTGNAWEKLPALKYDRLRLSCWQKTGCLITADGSNGDLIKPEGLPNYQVLTSCILGPPTQIPVDNEAPDDTTRVGDDCNEFGNDTELVTEESGDGDTGGNIFEIMDQFLLSE